ncbi:MAG: TIGR00159 family protein [Planctomycetes bacterium]|nr:TIGR00159 family protein [Planctomycetota bacterium]
MNHPAELLRNLLGPGPLFELALLWIGCYFVLRFLRGSLGLGILRGVLIAAFTLFLVVQLVFERFAGALPRLELLLRPSLQILVPSAVILFQPELRRAFTRLGETQAFRRFAPGSASLGRILAEAAERMSRRRVGALIAIERATGLQTYMEGSVELDAELKAPLLESIFQPGGPLHDGAVLVRNGRIAAAGCLLPLSENPDIGAEYGTRHRAGVGVTEDTDALAVVVSEETGNISVAARGELKRVKSARELARLLDDALAAGEMRQAGGRG